MKAILSWIRIEINVFVQSDTEQKKAIISTFQFYTISWIFLYVVTSQGGFRFLRVVSK